MTTATIYRPRIISIPASPYCELARWTLDRLGIPYQEEGHAPILHSFTGGQNGGSGIVSVDTGEASLRNAREVLDYYESRCLPNQKLYPAEAKVQAETRRLFDFFFETFGMATLAWAYAHMLRLRIVTVRAWTDRVPWWERLGVNIFYPLLIGSVRRNLAIEQDTISKQEQVIENAFTQVESRLADGRRFLLGDRLTAADLALAALAAPILLPVEYGGPVSKLEDLPADMRVTVERWRARAAGRFILRLYKEERSSRAPDLVALGKHASGHTFKDKLANFLVRPGVLRPLFTLLRRFFPLLVIGKHALVTRFNDVVEVLKRDNDFTISQVNAPKINKIDGPFILGMDASAQYDRESTVLHQAVRREDLDRIRAFVAHAAAELIDAARPRQRIDVVGGLARVVALRLVASYFGMPGPNEPTMMRWMRDVFHYIFADLTNDESVIRDALNSTAELRRHMDAQIALRKSQLLGQPESIVLERLMASQDEMHWPVRSTQVATGNSSPDGHCQKDDVLARLLDLQDTNDPWLDDNAVRRNLAGVIVGAVDTTSKFVTLAIDELLRRPKSLAEARAAALKGDTDAVRRYAWEAVRFNPHHPLQVRYCARDTKIASGQRRSKNIPAGTITYVATLSAMFDPEVFENPREFDAQRKTEYLHFGYGMHSCFGRAINGVQIPELAAALLRLPNLRRAAGKAGQIHYDGPFPDRLILEFDD